MSLPIMNKRQDHRSETDLTFQQDFVLLLSGRCGEGIHFKLDERQPNQNSENNAQALRVKYVLPSRISAPWQKQTT